MLIEALRRRGYPIRRHLDEEGWTRRKLTVVDLADDQRTALREGGSEALRAALQAQGAWTFPALDIEQPLPRRADLILAVQGAPVAAVVAPGAHPALRA